MTRPDTATTVKEVTGAMRFLNLLIARDDIPSEWKQYLRMVGADVLAEMIETPASTATPTRLIPTNPATHETKGTPL